MTTDTAEKPTKVKAPPPVPQFPRPIWQGELAVPYPLWEDAEQLAIALQNHATDAYDAAHRRGVKIVPHEFESEATPAVLLFHPSTGAPMLVPEEEAADQGFSTTNRMMRVRMTWYGPLKRKGIQAKHLHDEDVFYAMEAACRKANERWATMPPIFTPRSECKTAMLPDIADALPDFPQKVILAKLRKMVRRGIVDGCTCGCRGDFQRVHPVENEDT
jgi:hypothetical protein